MNTQELSDLTLDAISGGAANIFGCRVTSVTDINLGIFGTIHVDTISCGGKEGTAVSYSPYKPA